LSRRIEPTVAPPAQRLRAVAKLAAAGIRVGVAIAPVLPHLTDEPATLAAVVRAAAEAGASFAWHGVWHALRARCLRTRGRRTRCRRAPPRELSLF